MKSHLPRMGLVFVSSLALSACAVAMASKHKGVDAKQVLTCQSKACFQTLPDTEITEILGHPDGRETVTYQSLQSRGSTSRAVMHGLLDVATLGIWEIAGTPIESSKKKPRYFIVVAEFDLNGDVTHAAIKSAN